MEPSAEFLEKLKSMEKLFKTYNGEKLKPRKGVVCDLAHIIEMSVSLPFKVIEFFVRCRMFFRMRVLNAQISSNRQKNKKMSKLIK